MNLDTIRDGDHVTIRAANGCVCLDFPEPGLAFITYEGAGYEAFVAPIIAEIEQRSAGPMILAMDASALASYETGFRKRWTDWMAANPPRAILILSRSRLVAMGIAIANSVLSGAIHGFSSRVEFERALDTVRGRSVRSAGEPLVSAGLR